MLDPDVIGAVSAFNTYTKQNSLVELHDHDSEVAEDALDIAPKVGSGAPTQRLQLHEPLRGELRAYCTVRGEWCPHTTTTCSISLVRRRLLEWPDSPPNLVES